MGRDGSVAPKERVNIVYKPATEGAAEEVELPLKLLMMGDYTLRPDATPLEDRKTINVDKDNFEAVLAKQALALNLEVPDALGEGGGSLAVALRFKKLADFEPEGITQQVPELRNLLELRAALKSLRSPIANERGFAKKLEALLGDKASRQRLLRELGIASSDGGDVGASEAPGASGAR